MEFHEVSEIFPLMQGEEFVALVRDIRENGQLQPIWTHQGKVIDGRNRYRACKELGIAAKCKEYEGDNLVSFVVSLNIQRRHLTASQRAALAVDVLPLLEAEAKARQTLGKKLPEVDGGKSSEKAAELFHVNRQYVSDAKKLKQAAPDVYAEVRSGGKTITEAKAEARKGNRATRLAEISANNQPLSDAVGRFNVIYADPPWQYEHVKTESRAIENQYPTMPLEEIKMLPVGEIVADDCVLFMWTTAPKLDESLSVLSAWGFSYRTCAVWDKEKIGMGYYFRQQHEILLVGSRGGLPVPEPAARVASVYREKRGLHSAKPDYYYGLIEAMYPGVRKIELFARASREGWSAWGNQSAA